MFVIYKTDNTMSKKIFLSLFVVFSLAFLSCENEPLEGNFDTSGGASDQFSAKVDGADFNDDSINVSVVTSTVEYISIVATVSSSGSSILLSIPTAHTTGTYNFTEFLEATSVSGSYKPDNTTINPAVPGTLTITAKTNNTISGTFQFTAAPASGTSGGSTYQITEGSFSVSY